MPYIGTFGNLDPDYERRQRAEMGRSLGLIVGAFQQRSDAKKAAEREEVDRYYALLGKYPELADLYGRDMVEKYGKSDPLLPQVVEAVGSEHRDATRQKLLEAKEDRERRLAFEGMMATAEQIKAGRPELSYPEQLRLSASMMDPKQRTLAESYLRKEIGQSQVPREFDPLQDVPVGRRALEFPEEVRPETLQATRYGAGLEQTPQQLESQRLQEASQALQEAGLGVRRQQAETGRQREERLREQAAKPGEEAETGAKAAKGLGKEISAGLFKDLGAKSTDDPAMQALLANLGVEPAAVSETHQPLTKTQANLIGNALESEVRTGKISRVEATGAADAARATYLSLLASGKSREEAIRMILKEIKSDADSR